MRARISKRTVDNLKPGDQILLSDGLIELRLLLNDRQGEVGVAELDNGLALLDRIPGLKVYLRQPDFVDLGQTESRSQYSAALQSPDAAGDLDARMAAILRDLFGSADAGVRRTAVPRRPRSAR